MRAAFALRRDHCFEDLAFVVHGGLEVAEVSIDVDEHLVQVPAPPRIATHVRNALLPGRFH